MIKILDWMVIKLNFTFSLCLCAYTRALDFFSFFSHYLHAYKSSITINKTWYRINKLNESLHLRAYESLSRIVHVCVCVILLLSRLIKTQILCKWKRKATASEAMWRQKRTKAHKSSAKLYNEIVCTSYSTILS